MGNFNIVHIDLEWRQLLILILFRFHGKQTVLNVLGIFCSLKQN